MTVLWMELRRSPLRWWLPVLIGLEVLALLGRGQWWIGEWPQTSVHAQIPAFYLAAVVAAAAEWSSARASRSRFELQIGAASRSRWRVEAMLLMSTVIYGVGVYLAGAVCAAVISAGQMSEGFLWPSYLSLGLLLLVTFAAIGHTVGRMFDSHFVAPIVCALGSIIVIAAFGTSDGIGLFVLDGSPFKELSKTALLGHLMLAVATVLLALFGRRPARKVPIYGPSPAMGITVAAVFLAALFVVSVSGPIQVSRPSPAQALCTPTAPRICLWPEDRKYLPDAAAMAQRMNALSGTFTVPSAFYEEGLAPPDAGAAGPPGSFYILEGSMWDSSESMADAILQDSRPHGCAATPANWSDSLVRAGGELSMWLAMHVYGGPRPDSMHGGPPGVDLNSIAAVLNQSVDEQSAWVQTRMKVFHDAYCG